MYEHADSVRWLSGFDDASFMRSNEKQSRRGSAYKRLAPGVLVEHEEWNPEWPSIRTRHSAMELWSARTFQPVVVPS
jgi:hypothetical protein